MIASLHGTIQSVHSYIVIEVHGVGYKVHIPQTVLELCQVGATIDVFTHQYIREDALDLYGFSSEAELNMFEQLISVSGIGPKAGLALLSQFSAEDLQRSIMSGDTTLLTKVSGIGKKTAERLILELKGSITDLEIGAHGTSLSEAANALEQLGYSSNEALVVLQQIDTSTSVEEQIKAALTLLGRQQSYDR